MIRIKIIDLFEAAKNRPENYYNDVLSHGKIVGGVVELEEDKYKMLKQKYGNNQSKVVKFTQSMATWAGSGFKKVQQHVYEKRLAICRKCQFWEEKGNLGMGKCLKCGCGRGKHWLPHEQCPIGLWGKEQ